MLWVRKGLYFSFMFKSPHEMKKEVPENFANRI
jgi:hypothetical protein